ncbi:hypothetical protein CPS_1843 [Colwellia psychrerythraea 34H]|uniref:Uncharacterized protein n=1 Tax=Colwellia psychrerythraea (strain 34H / ATCC BAA-681) TaxID=167879 RepID=Q484E2_COLP3|nr:hypothetical protein CPS_1843 [Colwellia psychrerythraea 34H]
MLISVRIIRFSNHNFERILEALMLFLDVLA